jgi:uroporphyrin-III C-methyltransferase
VAGFVSLVGAGPGDPELITLRGYRRLRQADIVLFDALVDPTILDGVSAEQLFVGKRSGQRVMSQERICDRLVQLGLDGQRVVRLKGGDPTVFGRGGEEALALARAGVAFEIVPGVSSVFGASSAAGISITHRGISEGFTVVTAHRRNGGGDFAIPRFEPRRTLVLLMGVRTTALWQPELVALGYPLDLPIAFVERGYTAQQRVFVTNVGEAIDASQRVGTPALVVIGEVVKLRDELTWFITDLTELAVADE